MSLHFFFVVFGLFVYFCSFLFIFSVFSWFSSWISSQLFLVISHVSGSLHVSFSLLTFRCEIFTLYCELLHWSVMPHAPPFTYLLCVEVGAAHMFEPAAPSVLQLSQTFSQWHLQASAWTCLFVQVVPPQSWNVSWKLDEELNKSVSWKECLFRLQEIRSQFDRSARVCARATFLF